MLSRPVSDLADLTERFNSFRGHNMAKAGLELAYMDLLAQTKGKSLSDLIGGTRAVVPVGVSLGIQPSLDQLLERVDSYLAQGLSENQTKDQTRMGRRCGARGSSSGIRTSCCQWMPIAHTHLPTEDILRALDDFGLLMIEQPLNHDDLLDHAKLQAKLTTSICLDESITSPERAKHALELESCRLINIKIGRVGGYSQALAIHDICYFAKCARLVWRNAGVGHRSRS